MRTIGAVPSVIAAMNSAVRPCLLARFGLAPWSSSSRTFAASVAAIISAVVPNGLWASTSAPLPIRNAIASTDPAVAASISGVSPNAPGALAASRDTTRVLS
jgi:hypothetical protein